MKKLSILLLLALWFCKGKDPDAENLLLSPKDFQQKLQATPNAVLLDVRTLPEVKEECIRGEINFDYQSEGFKTLIAGLDKSKPYFVYCAAGTRSAKAADMMGDLDFKKVYTLDGGLKAWKAEGLPTRKNQ